MIVSAPSVIPADRSAPAAEDLLIAPPSPRRRTRPASATAPKSSKPAKPKRRKAAKSTAAKPAGTAKTGQTARKATASKPRAAPRSPRVAKPAPAEPATAALPLPSQAEALVLAQDPQAPVAEPAGVEAGRIEAGRIEAGRIEAGRIDRAADSMPRSRALVRPQVGLVARVVAWLDRLIPRRKRTALPKVRTRIARPAPEPKGRTEANAMAQPPVAPPESASELARRMLLQLSDENERLRREIERLRATAGQPQP